MSGNWRNVTLSELNTELAFVIHENDPAAAENLINYFHQRFEDIGLDGCPQGDIGILCEYMQHVFSKMIVDGYKVEQAFGLKRRKGKYPRDIPYERDYEIAAHVVLLIRQGMTWLDAKGEASNRYFEDGKGEKAVEAAYEKYKAIFQGTLFSDDELKAISDGSLRS